MARVQQRLGIDWVGRICYDGGQLPIHSLAFRLVLPWTKVSENKLAHGRSLPMILCQVHALPVT